MRWPLRALVLGLLVAGLSPAPAGAQTDDDRRADIAFDVGEFDAELGDWTIDAVEVAGELVPGEDVTVELADEQDLVLWSGTATFTAPVTRIPVDRVVAVRDVVEARLAQDLPTEVAGVQQREAEVLSQGAGGGGSGELALSLVLAMFFLAILFRTPLPSATSERWTK